MSMRASTSTDPTVTVPDASTVNTWERLWRMNGVTPFSNARSRPRRAATKYAAPTSANVTAHRILSLQPDPTSAVRLIARSRTSIPPPRPTLTPMHLSGNTALGLQFAPNRQTVLCSRHPATGKGAAFMSVFSSPS